MARRAILLLLVCLPGAGFPAAARAQGGWAQFGDISVAVGEVSGGNCLHGYTEYPVFVRNMSRQVPHEVRLVLPKHRQMYPVAARLAVARTVHVGPGEEVRVSLLQPDVQIADEGLEVTVDGETFPDGIGLTFRPHSFFYPFQRNLVQVNVLASKGTGGLVQSQVWVAPRGDDPLTRTLLRDAFSGMNQQVIVARSDVKAWSPHWLAYSSFDAVVLTGAELRALAGTDVWPALARYVECGGCLVVVGPWQVPAAWRRRQTPLGDVPSFPLVAARAVGLLGTPSGTGPLLAVSAEVAQGQDLVTYHAGFGLCLATPRPNSPNWQRPHVWRHLVRSWQDTAATLAHVRSPSEANRAFPVADHVETPVRGLFFLMLVFAVAIGPVNLYLLARTRRRLWMLWTVPALALVTCLAVFGTMLSVEGWRGRVRTEGLTFLDEATGRASTLAWAGYYMPIAPRDGLHFGPDTELAPQLANTNSTRDNLRSLDWTDGEQHLTSGWVAARLPAHFRVRKSEANRPERLTVRRDRDGAAIVSNGLGAAARQVWVAGPGGTIYTASDVAAGGAAPLTPTALHAVGRADGPRQLFDSDWTALGPTLTERPQDYLRPGCYVAALDGSPFLEPGLAGAADVTARTVVYGILKEPGDAD